MKKWIIGICVGLLLLVVVGVYSVFASVRATMDSYAVWDAALVVIHHMETHDGAWPRNWQELEQPPTYEDCPVHRKRIKIKLRRSSGMQPIS